MNDARLYGLCSAYIDGKRRLIELGYADELDWQESINLADANETDILREGAWAILSCGLSERAVRSVFPRLASVFDDWRRPSEIARSRSKRIRSAQRWFNHPAKLNAIVNLADFVAEQGAKRFIELLDCEPDQVNTRVPFLGPVSTRHLKKSLGFAVAKPDRHLIRLASRYGLKTDEFCDLIVDRTSEKKSVVDLVLWRLCEQGLERQFFGGCDLA
jgi:hypothetical protein